MIHAYASRSHYADHLAPVWDALGRPGRLMTSRDMLAHPSLAQRGATVLVAGSGPMLVAGYPDLFRARRFGYGPFALMQHGSGQSYNGDRRSAGNHSYAGGSDHDDVRVFVVPGPDPARRWAERYPDARVVIAGNTRPLPAREGPRGRVIAATFHWPCSALPEVGAWGWKEYRDALPGLMADWTLIGHWHPRWADNLRHWYERHNIEPVESIDEVARRADVLIADNTSAMYEFAATGRPVVVLNATRYRRDVPHGLRFWDAAGVGVQVDSPDRLAEAVAMAYADPAGLRAGRREALAMVYGPGDAATAADAIAASM